MYQIIYDLFVNAFYAGLTMTGEMTLTATLVATAGCLFCFAVPFIVVFKVIKFICGRC